MAEVKFKLVASLTAYDSLTKLDNYLYYVTENGMLFKGSQLYGGTHIKLGDSEDFPTTGRNGCLYYKPLTGEVRRYFGDVWNMVCYPLNTSISTATDNLSVAGAKAVKDYVDSVKSATLSTVGSNYMPLGATSANGYLLVGNSTGGTTASTLTVGSVVTTTSLTATLNTNNYVKSVAFSNGDIVVTTHNGGSYTLGLPAMDIFKGGNFDESTGVLSLEFTDNEGEDTSIDINLTSLVDVYTGNGQYYFNYPTLTLGTGKDTLSTSDVLIDGSTAYIPYNDNTSSSAESASFESFIYVELTNTTATIPSDIISAGKCVVLYNGIYYKITNIGSILVWSALLSTRTVYTEVSGYQISVKVTLSTTGHIVDTSTGLAVETVRAIGSSTDEDSIPTVEAVVDYVDNATETATLSDSMSNSSGAKLATAGDISTYVQGKYTLAKTYADGVGSTTLSTAKTYADGVGASTLTSAKSYADSTSSTALASAKTYADELVAGSGLVWEE